MINSELIPINGILINILVALIRFISFTLMLWSFCGGIIPKCGSGEAGLFAYEEEEAQPTMSGVGQYTYSCRWEKGGILRARNRSSDRIAMALIIRITTALIGPVSYTLPGIFSPLIHSFIGGGVHLISGIKPKNILIATWLEVIGDWNWGVRGRF